MAHITFGASPCHDQHDRRRARAFLRARNYVLPEDVIDLVPDVLRHRLVLSYEALSDGLTADQIVMRVLQAISAPDKPLEAHVRVAAAS